LLNAVMKTTRLFIPQPIVASAETSITGDRAHYLKRVLRLRIGDNLVVFDGNGNEYPAEILDIEKRQMRLSIGSAQAGSPESPLAIRLVQGIARSERMDFVVQKATELGVRRISPIISVRSIVRLDQRRSAKRHDHWLKIAQNACEQCGRNTIPQIDPAQALDDWLDDESETGSTRIFLTPRAGTPIGSMPEPSGPLLLLIGPEGGLSDMESSKVDYAGFLPVSLGPRILRTETASLAAIAILQSRFGDLA
jgi:16S rRNA (uracil1498-N3)-methyltransferase